MTDNLGTLEEPMDAWPAVKQLMAGTMPERIEELEAAVSQYGAVFRNLPDKPEYFVQEGYGATQFTSRTMKLMWLLGYAGDSAFKTYMEAIISHGRLHEPFILDTITRLPRHPEEKRKYEMIVGKVAELAAVSSIHDFNWPEAVPFPKPDKDASENEAVFRLMCLATSFIFLHELKHAIRSLTGESPLLATEEEIQCDSYAKTMMISKIPDYACAAGVPENKVLLMRMMGIALAQFFVLVITPPELWKGSDTHPPLRKRILSVTNGVDLEDDSMFWVFMSTMIISQLCYTEKVVAPIQYASYKELCIRLIDNV